MARVWIGLLHSAVHRRSARDRRRRRLDRPRDSSTPRCGCRRAPEYRAIAEQVYRLATERIAAPAPGSAALEQAGRSGRSSSRACPPPWCSTSTRRCSTTPSTRRGCCATAPSTTPQSWGEWVAPGEAEAVPGAREFIAAARRLGHTVFYISNRDCTTPAPRADDPCPAKTATMRNLVALGIDPSPDPGTHAAARRTARSGTGTKTQRRAFIAANYRIVALVGDDLGDFVDPRRYSPAIASASTRASASNWFLLPNPIYGSWTNPYDTLEEKYAGAAHRRPGAGTARRRALARRREARAHRELERRIPDDAGNAPGAARQLRARTAAWWAATIARCPARSPSASRARRPTTRRCAATPRELRADIVALQEVDGPDAAEQVFPGYDFCFSTRGAHAEERLRDPPRPAASLRARVRAAVARTTPCAAAWSSRSSPARPMNSG